MKPSRIYIGITILLAAFLSGCAQKGPLLVDFRYERPKSSAVEAPKNTVAVSSFKDERGKSESVVGTRYSSLNNVSSDLVVQGTVSDKVTDALINALTAREITVHEAAPWDLTDKDVPPNPANILISGEIKTLWAEATSSLANANVKADVQLRIVVADMTLKKIVRVVNVSSIIQRQNIAFSPAFVESTFSEAVTTAINQIFNDEDLKNRLK